MMRLAINKSSDSPLLGGMLSLLNAAWKDRLTVLAYHRVTELEPEQFEMYKTVVSATPEEFERQLEFVASRFSVITAQELLAWLSDRQPLPPAPLLITFDDGYRDNFENAFPILQRKRLTATVFVSTDFLDGTAAFYWDFVAYCFHHTSREGATLPLLGTQRWERREDRERVALLLLKALKRCDDDKKKILVSQLPHLLDIRVAADAFQRLSLTWDQVRLMAKAGFEFGGHTTSHPILTRMPLATAEHEISHAKARLEAETGQPARLFAFPNGKAADFNEDLKHAVQKAGFRLAFTLLPGPLSLPAVLADPFAVRRILVSRKDTLPRFAAKLLGAARLAEKFH